MSEIELPKPYAADNYAKALDNLTKRFEKEGGEIHFSDVAFDGLSEDQAGSALKFFGDIGLIEIPKQGHYTPPDHVVTWRRSIEGPAKDQAKERVTEDLKSYEVFDELLFLIENSESKKVEELAHEIGGKIGISQDIMDQMVRTIEILAACGFFEIGEDDILTLSDAEFLGKESDDIEGDDQTENDGDERVQGEGQEPATGGIERDQDGETSPEPPIEEGAPTGSGLKLNIEIDATEMDPEDLKTKLEIISEVGINDEISLEED